MKIRSYYLKKIAAWLLPNACILCGGHSSCLQDLCSDCREDLPEPTFACPTCARPLTRFTQNFSCDYCLINPSLPFDRTYALYFYQQPVTKLIMDLKFGEALANAQVLGQLLAHKIQQEWYRDKHLPEVIIPVPLHPKRMKQRGYNQALEIARPVAKPLQLPLDTELCQRVKYTSAQATLTAKDRENNVRDAFQLTQTLPYQHIAVLDDVITTGGTIKEICSLLKNNGAKTIDVWCCARPRPGQK